MSEPTYFLVAEDDAKVISELYTALTADGFTTDAATAALLQDRRKYLLEVRYATLTKDNAVVHITPDAVVAGQLVRKHAYQEVFFDDKLSLDDTRRTALAYATENPERMLRMISSQVAQQMNGIYELADAKGVEPPIGRLWELEKTARHIHYFIKNAGPRQQRPDAPAPKAVACKL